MRQPIDTVCTRPVVNIGHPHFIVPYIEVGDNTCCLQNSHLIMLVIIEKELLTGRRILHQHVPSTSCNWSFGATYQPLPSTDAGTVSLDTRPGPHSIYRTEKSYMCPLSEHHGKGAFIYSRNAARILEPSCRQTTNLLYTIRPNNHEKRSGLCLLNKNRLSYRNPAAPVGRSRVR